MDIFYKRLNYRITNLSFLDHLMKKQLLDQIIKKKENKNEFAIITNIANGESCIFEKNKPLDKILRNI